VKPNQKIKAGDKIGEIGKDPATGKTVLSFVLAKNATKLDPADWIMQM
jgi:septal ring factor EnvC (AmiA/AmiB activator)